LLKRIVFNTLDNLQNSLLKMHGYEGGDTYHYTTTKANKTKIAKTLKLLKHKA